MLALLVLFVPQAARAEGAASSESALAVSPAIIEEVPVPGAATKFSVQVQNITQIPLPIKTFVSSLLVDDNSLSKNDRARLDASEWFKVADPDFILQPKQLRTVTGTIAPPKDSVPGGHYATIFFQPLVPQDALSPSTAYINARVGVLAFLIIKGDVQQKAEIKDGLKTKALAQGGPIDFTFSIKNTGNVHVVPSGDIHIYDMFGKEVAKLALPTGIVLPDSTKDYTVSWESPPIGVFSAELTVKYGADNTALPKMSAKFWVFPWMPAVLVVVIIGGILLFVRKIRPRWRRAWREFRGSKWRL